MTSALYRWWKASILRGEPMSGPFPMYGDDTARHPLQCDNPTPHEFVTHHTTREDEWPRKVKPEDLEHPLIWIQIGTADEDIKAGDQLEMDPATGRVRRLR